MLICPFLIAKFDLVCGYRSTLPSLVTSMYTLGLLLGSLISGVVSDKYGRRVSFSKGTEENQFLSVYEILILITLQAMYL